MTLPTAAHFGTIGNGRAGTYDTLHRMIALVRSDRAWPGVRLLAASIVAGVPGTSPVAQIGAIRAWLSDHVRFLRDPRGVELLHAPSWQVAEYNRTGSLSVDCDDVAMLAAALGMAIGLRARFVVLGRQSFEHVYAELAPPNGLPWLEQDITREQQDPAILATFQLRQTIEVPA